MSTLRYTTDHEWLREDGEGLVTLGITDYAQDQLGDIVYVELPAPGQRCAAGDNLVVIESVKAVGEVRLPVAATVDAVNARLEDAPELVNQAPLGDGWLVRLALDPGSDLSALMDQAAYERYLAGL
jgi:glycine cleavage system H protein